MESKGNPAATPTTAADDAAATVLCSIFEKIKILKNDLKLVAQTINHTTYSIKALSQFLGMGEHVD